VEVAFRYFFSESIKELLEWDKLLPEIEYALNISINAIIGYIPFFLLYGVHLKSKINSIPTFYNNIE
jgi:hypothetical protein